MAETSNYVKINENGKLEIHSDNACFVDGKTTTQIMNKDFIIKGSDLMKIYVLLSDEEITTLYNCRSDRDFAIIDNYMIIGKDVEKERIMKMYVNLLKEVENINNTRHWWERKIKIDSL